MAHNIPAGSAFCLWAKRLLCGACTVIFAFLTVRVCINCGNPLLFGCGLVVYAALACALFSLMAPRVNAMAQKHFTLLLAGLCVLYGVLLFTVALQMRTRFDYDMAIIYKALPNLLDDGIMQGDDYFVLNPNNIGALVLLGLVYKIGGVFGFAPGDSQATGSGMEPGIFANVLCIVLAVWLACRITQKLTDGNAAPLFTFLLCALFAPFLLWAPIFYTHTLSLPFVCGAVYAYLCARERHGVHRWALLVLGAVLCALGYWVKGSVLVVAIATALALLLEPSEKFPRRLLQAAVFLLVCFLCIYALQAWQQNSGVLDFSNYDAIHMPLEIWFCFGAHGDGGWDIADRIYAQTFATYAQRQAAMRVRLAEYYAQFTPGEYCAFLDLKLMRIWGDGKCDAQGYLTHPYAVNWTQNIVFEQFFPYKVFSIHCQVFLLLLYLGTFAFALRSTKAPTHGGFYLLLNLFGLFLFLCFWEAQAGYILNFMPLAIVCCTLAIKGCAQRLPKRHG